MAIEGDAPKGLSRQEIYNEALEDLSFPFTFQGACVEIPTESIYDYYGLMNVDQ